MITEDIIKALNELGFEWEDTRKSLEERIDDLKAYKYGHVRVPLKLDKSLGHFCEHMRAARRGKGNGFVITDDRSKALDNLGFIWDC